MVVMMKGVAKAASFYYVLTLHFQACSNKYQANKKRNYMCVIPLQCFKVQLIRIKDAYWLSQHSPFRNSSQYYLQAMFR